MHPDKSRVERDHLRKALQETPRAHEKLALIGVSLALNVRFTPKKRTLRSAICALETSQRTATPTALASERT